MTVSGSLLHLHHGQTDAYRHADDRIVAVVRGRVRIELGGDGAVPVWLRPSDALAIPALTRYTVQALQDTEIYLYADRSAPPALWGV